MISPPSAQEGTFSRRLEHKSLISKPFESKTRSPHFPMEWLLGLRGGSRAERCPDPGPLFRQPCTRPPREPHHSTSNSNNRGGPYNLLKHKQM